MTGNDEVIVYLNHSTDEFYKGIVRGKITHWDESVIAMTIPFDETFKKLLIPFTNIKYIERK